MFKKIGALLTRRPAAAQKPAPELESVPAFRAHLLARGLSAKEADDVMLDRYWFGNVDRISPEAPVPVVHIQRTEERLGGAANVACNIAGLGAQAYETVAQAVEPNSHDGPPPFAIFRQLGGLDATRLKKLLNL